MVRASIRDWALQLLRTSLNGGGDDKITHQNAFPGIKISFSNEIGNICKPAGDRTSMMLMKGVGMDSRISPHFLKRRGWVGGSCFPKDVAAIDTPRRRDRRGPCYSEVSLRG